MGTSRKLGFLLGTLSNLRAASIIFSAQTVVTNGVDSDVTRVTLFADPPRSTSRETVAWADALIHALMLAGFDVEGPKKTKRWTVVLTIKLASTAEAKILTAQINQEAA